MVRIWFAAVLAAVVLSGWTTSASATPKSYLTEEGTARMMAADTFTAKWDTARQICVDNGLALGTDQFKRCYTEYQLHSLQVLRTRAKALTETVTKKHGLCIDRKRFEFARCKEI
jgi:hypothetical protein